MKICAKHGTGCCIGCTRRLPNSWGDICRYDAEWMLDCLFDIIDTEWTQEQAEIFADFEIEKE